MSKVFTANVFITKSRQAIEQLFFPGNKVTSFSSNLARLTPAQQDASFIASPGKNEGLLRLEYSYGMNKGNDPPKVMVSFVETSKLIEFALLDDGPTAKKVAHLFADQSYNSFSKAYEEGISSQLKRLSTKEEHAEIFNSLKHFNTYYFAFGVGDDVRNWDGPHIMHLAAATLSNDDSNVRTVDATFVANMDSLKVWSRHFEKEMGYGSIVKKFSQVYSAKSYHQTRATVGPILFDKESKSEDPATAKQARAAYSDGEVDLNDNVRTLIQRYIGAVNSRRGNVVVAFPHDLETINVVYPQDYGYDVPLPVLTEYSRDLLGNLGITYSINNQEILIPTSPPAKAINPVRKKATPIPKKAPTPGKTPEDLRNELERSQWRELLGTHEPARKSKLVDKVKDAVHISISSQVAHASQPPDLNIPESSFLAFLHAEIDDLIKVRKLATETVGVNPFIAVETKRVAMIWQPAVDSAYTKFMETKPEGMNENGKGNTDEYMEKQKKKAAKSLAPSNPLKESFPSDTSYLNSVDYTQEQTSPKDAKSSLEDSIPSITLSMSLTNYYSQGKVSGFKPLLSPLTKFAGGLADYPQFLNQAAHKSIDSVVFDFFEETDVRILFLWEKFGIVQDSENSAFVFGDVQKIKNVLYLDNYKPHYLRGKEDAMDIRVWESIVNEENKSKYKEYRDAFATTFNLKSSPGRSSFEEYDIPPENSLASSLAKTRKFDFASNDILLTHNIENPNVVSLKYSTKNYITSLHGMQLYPELDNKVIGSTKGDAIVKIAKRVMGDVELASLLDMVDGNDEASIRATLELDPRAKGKLAEILANALISKEFPELAGIQMFDIVSLLIMTNTYEKNLQKVKDNSNVAIVSPLQRLVNVKKDVMDRYARQLFEVKVKTLPLFNHKLFVLKTCGLIGMTGGVVGSDTSLSKGLRHLAPYTGNFSIVGWKHVISSSEISTSLSLIRAGFSQHELAGKSTLKYVRESLEARKAEILQGYKHLSDEAITFNTARDNQMKEKTQRFYEEAGQDIGLRALAGVKVAGYRAAQGLEWVYNTLVGDGASAKPFLGVQAALPPPSIGPSVRAKAIANDKTLTRLQKLIDELPQGT